MRPDGTTRYYVTDQVDSVSMVLNEQGKPLTRFEYMPYGEEWITKKDPSITEKHKPKFNSQELDEESGFYYYNARHYDPEISRFVTPDSVVDGEHDVFGWNRYMYVKGNPVGAGDPSGNEGSSYHPFTRLMSYAQRKVQDIKASFHETKKKVKRNFKVAWKFVKRYGERSISNFSASTLGCPGKVPQETIEKLCGLPKARDEVERSADALANSYPNTVVITAIGAKRLRFQPRSNFKGRIKKQKLKEDRGVYRVYTGADGQSGPRGSWLSPLKPKSRSSVIEDLALPEQNPAKFVERQIVPKGTTVLEGKVRPQFGRKGGGNQIYVEDSSVIIRIKKTREVLPE